MNSHRIRSTRGRHVLALLASFCFASIAGAGTPPCQCAGDADGDGLISVTDLVAVITAWGACPPPCEPACPEDFNGDCQVDVSDLLTVVLGWGTCPQAQPDPGPTLPQATDLGTIGDAPVNICDAIGINDTDVYRFEITEARAVNVALTNRVDGIFGRIIADLDGDGVTESNEILNQDLTAGPSDLVLSEDLVAGTYYVWIDPNTFGNYTAYSMRITTSALGELMIDPGETLPEAHDLGVLGAPEIELEEVTGGFDPVDLYRFTIESTSEVSFTITGRTEGINGWILIDLNGNMLYESGQELLQNAFSVGPQDVAGAEDLVAGTYYLWVEPWFGDDSTRYTLRLSATPLLETTTEDPGEMLLDAYDLGALDGQMFNEFQVVGGSDAVDVYRFTLDTEAEVVAMLTGRTEGARIILVNDANGNWIFDGNEIEANAQSTSGADISAVATLPPGEYFVWVDPWDSQDSTRYELTLLTN